MVFSYYLFKIPYSIVWHVSKIFRRLKPVVFYCGDPIDYYVFEPVNLYLNHVAYVTDKPKVRAFLKSRGILSLVFPVFPETVIMARHSTYKFPCNSILKIGMRHGAYHFKKMTSADNYNKFDLFLMTSQSDVQAGKQVGILTALAVGFPKLDPIFQEKWNESKLAELYQSLNLEKAKPTILFSATYNKSGMSAIHLWSSKLLKLTSKYNVLVTLHPWIKYAYKEQIQSTPGVHLIRDYYTLPYIMLSDVVVGDTSSFIAECCALDKPIITFRTSQAKRTLSEIDNIIDSISYRITSFNELQEKLIYVLGHRNELAAQRAEANIIFFDVIDGHAGERAANAILQLIQKGK
jgi:CDP-glycerol glycerophosphotransferase (TagB/SpsB family)